MKAVILKNNYSFNIFYFLKPFLKKQSHPGGFLNIRRGRKSSKSLFKEKQIKTCGFLNIRRGRKSSKRQKPF